MSCLIPPAEQPQYIATRESGVQYSAICTYIVSPEVIRRLSVRGWKSRLYVEVMAKTSVLCLCISTMTRRPLTRKRLNSRRDGDKTRQSRCKAVRSRVLAGVGGVFFKTTWEKRGTSASFPSSFNFSRVLSPCLPSFPDWNKPGRAAVTPRSELQQSRGVAFRNKSLEACSHREPPDQRKWL